MVADRSPADDLITVGRIGAPFAVRGWSKIRSFTRPAANILDYSPWMVGREGDWQAVEIGESEVRGDGQLVVRFAACRNREDAERVTGRLIAVSRDCLPQLSDGEYYLHQLEGLVVENLAGVRFGQVREMLETGANDVLVVDPDADSVDDRKRLIPWVEGRYVIEVSLERGVIRVDWEADY